MPEWFRVLLDQHGVEVDQIGTTDQGLPIWACMGDCGCWFVINDGEYIDRYSYVNEAGWCQGQSCPCHELPKTRPGSDAEAI